MIFHEALPFIDHFLKELNNGLKETGDSNSLSDIQKNCLAFYLMGILITNSLCWSKFYRASLGQYRVQALSWMFRKSKIFWDKLLTVGIGIIIKKYKLDSGELILDDTDKSRSKNTTRIFKTHKIFDKKTAGYFNGQSIVFLILVTDKITIPVGFSFYHPDPKIVHWQKTEEELKAAGVPKALRFQKPNRNPLFPSKSQLGQQLIGKFRENFQNLKIKAIMADAFYGSLTFINGVSKIYPQTQIISQLKCSQLVVSCGKTLSVEDYFKRTDYGSKSVLSIRGQKPVKVFIKGARLKVDSHGKKRYVVALKYESDKNFRYIFASDLCWRMKDILQTYSLRWLVEVFFQDWKGSEGWRELKLLDVEGSERAVILSLLLDYSLLFHPAQLKLVENKLPAFTVGSLLRQCRVEAFLQFIRNLLESLDPFKYLKNIEVAVREIYQLSPSAKHMNGRNLGRIGPTPGLKYRREKNAFA